MSLEKIGVVCGNVEQVGQSWEVSRAPIYNAHVPPIRRSVRLSYKYKMGVTAADVHTNSASDYSELTLPRRPWRLNVTEFKRIVEHPYRGSGTSDDPYIVEWLQNDSENPKDYSPGLRWSVTALIAIKTLGVALASSAYSGAIGSLLADFQCSQEVAILGLSLMVLGYAVGMVSSLSISIISLQTLTYPLRASPLGSYLRVCGPPQYLPDLVRWLHCVYGRLLRSTEYLDTYYPQVLHWTFRVQCPVYPRGSDCRYVPSRNPWTGDWCILSCPLHRPSSGSHYRRILR